MKPLSKQKILIVGAGFSGATVARLLANEGASVDVIDKRNHVGGNAHDLYSDFGIRYHKYGPHLFHTNNEKVWNFLSLYTSWIPYRHKVKALLEDGRLVTLPVNRETKEIVGEENVLDIFFRPYTRKMWGMELDELSPTIVNRVPIRDDMNEYYFPDDKYQALPSSGYTALIMNMLTYHKIRVMTNYKFTHDLEENYDHVFNSMPIDEYHDFKYGELPYRSIKFTHVVEEDKKWPAATINFTDNLPYTRKTNWKMLPGHTAYGIPNNGMTLVTHEEPCDYKENNMERYYPVKDKDGNNRELYSKYKSIPTKNTTFIGRLGQYAYLDMDQAVSSAFATAEKYIQKYV